MRSKKIEAYCYYKQQYPETVVFFRVGENYEVYQEDAEIVGKIVGLHTEKIISNQESLTEIKFPVTEGYEYVSQLASHNINTKMISYRNESGEFDLPNVDELKKDKEIDY